MSRQEIYIFVSLILILFKQERKISSTFHECSKCHVHVPLRLCSTYIHFKALNSKGLSNAQVNEVCRAYPGPEFVVANTLAKWKKLEPNEITLSQGFSQKVISRTFFVLNPLPTSSYFCHLLITFANSLNPDQARQNVRPDMDPYCLTP